jgi:hypothetical protein
VCLIADKHIEIVRDRRRELVEVLEQVGGEV